MLIIQEIVTVWHKSERGGEFSDARSKFTYACELEEKPDLSDECVYDYRRFYQVGKKFHTSAEYDSLLGYGIRILPKRAYKSPNKLSELEVRNVCFNETENGIETVFFYDPRKNGQPFRRGHNKDYNNSDSRFYGQDILNETAFILKDCQKGRIMYNGRFSDYDTGQWWYEQTAVNIANMPFEKIGKNVFLNGRFDFLYKQLEPLR